MGALMLYVINLIGGLFEFHIGINYITAIFTGILGVPRSYFIGGTENGFRLVGASIARPKIKI